MSSWESYLSDSDRAVLEKGKFGRRMGFGARPAVIVIDAQRYMVGEPGRDAEWPSSCGEIGREAVRHIARIVSAAQERGVPCFFTRFELDRSGSDMGVYRLKRDLLSSDRWCLAGTLGAELVPELQPGPGDIEFVKKKPSGFHATPLLGFLISRGVIASGRRCSMRRPITSERSSHRKPSLTGSRFRTRYRFSTWTASLPMSWRPRTYSDISMESIHHDQT